VAPNGPSPKFPDNKFNKISHEIEVKKVIVEWLRLTDTLVSKKDISDAQTAQYTIQAEN